MYPTYISVFDGEKHGTYVRLETYLSKTQGKNTTFPIAKRSRALRLSAIDSVLGSQTILKRLRMTTNGPAGHEIYFREKWISQLVN